MVNAPPIRYARSSDGTNIAYTVAGGGPPLVQPMGWHTGLEANWQHPDYRRGLERLGAGRRFVTYDGRGEGASQRDVDDLSLPALVADLSAVVDELALERFDLVGRGAAGAVAAAYAAQYPTRVSRLVLWHPLAIGDEFMQPEAVRSVVALALENWGFARRAIASTIFPSGPIELQRWFSNALRDSLSSEVAAKYLEFESGADVRPLLPRVQAPTLVLHRQGNRGVSIRVGRLVAALIPNARFVSLEGDIDHCFFGDTSWIETATAFLDEDREPELTTAEAAPSGFQTILFTDLEGSTALTQRLGDEGAQELLRGHNAAVRAALDEHGGHEVKHTGDGIMASFPSAVSAVTAALQMQRDLAGGEVRVRIGLNAGEPIAEDDDLFGTAVQLAARITDRAEPGQVLVSNVVRELCAGKTFEFTSMGDATLKGFDEPVALYEVTA